MQADNVAGLMHRYIVNDFENVPQVSCRHAFNNKPAK